MIKIFEEDELKLMKINPNWTPEELLEQEGLFFLKDVVKILGIETPKVIKKGKELADKGKSPWEEMGLRKIWTHWGVRMKVFGPFYNKYLKPRYQHVQPDWDSNQLLVQKGVYLLSEICELLPFNIYQLRHQAKKNENAKEEYGIWKDEICGRWVVNMDVFSPWIKNLVATWNTAA